MQFQVRELEYCKINVDCLADANEIKEKKLEVLKTFKSAPVPGFRKGRADLKSIEYYYKKQINDALTRALAEEAFHQAMFEKQFKPLGNPNFTELFLQPSSFSCQFVVHKKPEFELQDFKSLEIPEPHKDFTQEEISNKLIEEVRRLQGERVIFTEDNFIETGDVASITYDAYIDGVKADQYSSENGEVLNVGSSKILEFDNNLLGMKVGDVREFEINIEEQKIKFSVKLNMAMRIVPAPLDDSLAKKIGKENIDEFYQEIGKQSFSIYENRVKELKHSALASKLNSIHNFDIPEWLSLNEAKMIASQNKINWESLSSENKENLISQSKNNVKFSLILEKIRDDEPGAQMSDQELFESARNYLSMIQKDPVDEIIKSMNNTGHLQMLINKIKDDNTINFIIKNVKFVQ